MTKTKLPKNGKRYRRKSGYLFKYKIVGVCKNTHQIKVESYEKWPIKSQAFSLEEFWHLFEEFQPEKPSGDHPEIFKGTHGCTYGGCDGYMEKPVVKESTDSLDKENNTVNFSNNRNLTVRKAEFFEEEKSLWKPVSELPEIRCHAITEDYLGRINIFEYDDAHKMFINLSDQRYANLDICKRWCTLTDFISYIERELQIADLNSVIINKLVEKNDALEKRVEKLEKKAEERKN